MRCRFGRKRRDVWGHTGHSGARAMLASPESIIPASVVSFEYWDYGFRRSLTRPEWRFFALPARANYFFAGAAGLSAEGLAWPAGLSRRSIVADLRRLSTSSACARRAT